MAAISLADIAARAKTYPSRADRFGSTWAKLAESVVDYPVEKVRSAASAPTPTAVGEMYYDTATNELKISSDGVTFDRTIATT